MLFAHCAVLRAGPSPSSSPHRLPITTAFRQLFPAHNTTFHRPMAFIQAAIIVFWKDFSLQCKWPHNKYIYSLIVIIYTCFIGQLEFKKDVTAKIFVLQRWRIITRRPVFHLVEAFGNRCQIILSRTHRRPLAQRQHIWDCAVLQTNLLWTIWQWPINGASPTAPHSGIVLLCNIWSLRS